jgi:hypothetical protein
MVLEYENWWDALISVISDNELAIITFTGFDETSIIEGNVDVTCYNNQLVLLTMSISKFRQIIRTKNMSIIVRVFVSTPIIEPSVFKECNNRSDVFSAYTNKLIAKNPLKQNIKKNIYGFFKTNKSKKIIRISQSQNEWSNTHSCIPPHIFIGHEPNVKYC